MRDADCVAFLRWALPRLELRWRGFRRPRRQVCRRVERRYRQLELSDVAAYRRRLLEDPTEWLDVWITAEDDDPDTPEIQLTVYFNGDTEPTIELERAPRFRDRLTLRRTSKWPQSHRDTEQEEKGRSVARSGPATTGRSRNAPARQANYLRHSFDLSHPLEKV